MDNRQQQQSIAVVGVACYYPGASNTRELWENILSRRVQFRRMLDQRLPLGSYYDEDPKAPEKTYGTKAAFIENFYFDWMKLRIPKKTFKSTDMSHWLALDTALRAFEDAGYLLNEIPIQNTGVIVGNTLTGEQTRSQTLRLRWPYVQKVLSATLSNAGMGIEEISRLAMEMEQIFKSAFYPITEDSLAGGLANTIAGRICNFLNFKGGGYIVDGACSSSLLAVASAANALKLGEMDLVLAGGVDISLDPFELVGFSKAGALAKDKMRVYDQRANGFVPGEGCGFVLLKRLEDALTDKNYIYAVINGWGVSSDGKGGIMEPSVYGQALAVERAYRNVGYKPCEVDFVEGHGTGTTKGDRVELEGIAAAIQQSMSEERRQSRFCGVTSFKSIVGHTKAAAGVGGLIKAILAVNQRILPPTANCNEPNDVFKDQARHLYPIIQGRVLAQNTIMRAGISSAGFGGINCHMTIESKDEPKAALKPKINERALLVSNQETEIFVFASRNAPHLKNAIRKFKEDLRNVSVAEMADLAALLNKKVKSRLPIKAAIVADSPEHLYDGLVQLENEIDQEDLSAGHIRRISSKDSPTLVVLSNAVKKNRIGFLYPGQGTQRLNMTRSLVERFPWARDFLALSTLSLFDCIYKTEEQALTKEEQLEFGKSLADTRITQPAVVISSLIWTEFLTKLGIEPQCVGGHSLGEVTAFYKAGAFDQATLVQFAEFRGALMAATGGSQGGMVSLLCSKPKAEALIKQVSGNIIIANINSPLQLVASGEKDAIDQVLVLAEKEGIAAIKLSVSNAFHSSFMKEASDKIRDCVLISQQYKKQSVDVFSCMDGTMVQDGADLQEYFARQVISPVHFVDLVRAMSSHCDVLIEVGYGRVLTDLVYANNKERGPFCLPVESKVGNDGDMNRVLAELFIRNIAIRWEELYANRLIRPFVRASRKKFIINQCERPLKIGEQVLNPEVLDIAGAEAAASEEETGTVSTKIDDKDEVAKLLVDLTQKLTGFSSQSITLESRLLDDLNLDSIKAAELIGQAARMMGLAGQLDPSQISNNTLGQIRDRLQALALQTGKVGESAPDNILKRFHNKRWVRNFVVDFRAEEIISKDINQLNALRNIVFLSEKNENFLATALPHALKDPVIRQKCYGEEAGLEEKADCLIAVLPRGQESASLDKGLKTIVERMRQVVDLATSSQLPEGAFVVLVQFGGGYFGEQDDLKDIASCCAKSLASTLFLERPDLKVRVIDCDRNSTEEQIASMIRDELSTRERFNAVGYDAHMTRRVVYYENSEPAFYTKRNISWSEKDVVVVTGGAKGVTAACALEFARLTKARMILLGRSSLPEESKDEANEIVWTLKKYRQQKLKCNYYQCDVTREDELVKVLKDIKNQFGKITGVVHGAGLNSIKRLKQSTAQEAYKEALPKVMGAVNLCRALSDDPPKLIVGITSIIGVTGMPGSGWYGLANEILNLYLHQFRFQNPQTQVATVAYSIWAEIGMGVKMGSVDYLAQQGIGAIPVEEGARRFGQLVQNDAGVQQVIVTARLAGLDTWKGSAPRANDFRFLENIRYFIPGVELIARAKLNAKDDPYLLDHNWRGSLLFPFVFGLEAMAQAVAQVIGLESFDQIKAEDISLERPIPVSAEDGAVIEIHALALEKDKKNSPRKIEVDVYSHETAYLQPHFSAVFEVGAGFQAPQGLPRGQKTPLNILDLDMATDIYGPILFQGKLFQCIDQIHELYYDEKSKKGECVFTSICNKSTEAFFKDNPKFNNRFLIGDPFFIDSMLQSMQVIIPQDVSLPVGIKSIEINLLANRCLPYQARSDIKRINAEFYRGEAEVYKDGTLVAIRNCRLKVLDTIPEIPSANDLVSPARRDEKIIRERVEQLSREMGFGLPVIKCLYDKRLMNAPKALRHRIELPLMKAAVEELLRRDKKRGKRFKIRWLSSGKPVVDAKGLDEIGISVSHSGSFLIVVAGWGKQGCDVEKIQHKKFSDWINILGKSKLGKLQERLRQLKISNKYDIYYTALWSATEVIKKNSAYSDKLIFEQENKNVFVFQYVEAAGNISRIIVLPNICIDRKKLISLIVNNSEQLNSMVTFGYNKDLFKMDLDFSGPQGQPVYVKRFPMTFQNCQSVTRSVYFSNFFTWMGEVREYSLSPIKDDLSRLMGSGMWGMATNYVKLHIIKLLKIGDVLEGRLWVKKVSGEKNSIVDLMFDWQKVLSNESKVRVAVSEQRISWVKITSSGVGKVESFPYIVNKFIESMKPKLLIVDSKLYPAFSENYDLGNIIRNYNQGARPLLIEQVFYTSFEESNLVGNIYFANYGKWLGKARDLYLHRFISECIGPRIRREFFCANCEISHISEAIPFDKINVGIFIDKIYEKGLELYFEFYKEEAKRVKQKLAYGKQVIIWGADKNGEFFSETLPINLLNHINH